MGQDNKILVITNSEQLGPLNKQQIKQIYMNGISSRLKPIHLNQGSKTRVIFNSTIIGLTESRINSYWIQMKFSGKAEPPLEVSDVQGVLKKLEKGANQIAYIPQGIELPSNVKVIYTLEY
jgi:hypothetical protein